MNEEEKGPTTEPKYRVNQMLRNTHTWAKDHPWAKDRPARPVEDVQWDYCWQCYTYGFPYSLIRIEEYELEPVDEPDMTPEEWVERYRQSQVAK